ncbi:MAG TPA: hypothetical protein VM686_28710 [Polyangiaceae bacterium]|nr:hypothetical protein [Polyangiaceae bacterium]
MTVDQLHRTLPERELMEWRLRGKPLWTRRLEVLLAQVAMFIARSTGNSDFELEDADLFGRREPEVIPDAQTAAVAIDAMAGGAGFVMVGKGTQPQEPEDED